MGQKPNEYEFAQFLGTDYKDLEYDIFIDVSAKAPVSRMKEAQDAKELMNMQGQYNFSPAVITPQELIKKSNYADSDAIIERMNQEEMNAKSDQLSQILDSSFHALSQGAHPNEVLQMAQEQLQQMEQKNGLGDTQNANNVQMQQSGTPVGMGAK